MSNKNTINRGSVMIEFGILLEDMMNNKISFTDVYNKIMNTIEIGSQGKVEEILRSFDDIRAKFHKQDAICNHAKDLFELIKNYRP